MKRFIYLFAVAMLITGSGCVSELLTADMPLDLTAPPGDPIDTTGKTRLEGVYYISQGNDIFGDTLVALYVRDHLCIYSGAEVIFSENAGSISSDTAHFAGYYRFVRSALTGNLHFSILPTEGGISLKTGTTISPITIRGTFEDPTSKQIKNIVMVRARSLFSTGQHFQILGNCAGGRNSERLGRSENSIEMGKFSEYLGCTGVEIDLHATQDGKIILIHDDSFSPRTVEGTYILGNISDFTLDQIRRNARLIHGEVIPTLSEFLTFVVDSTNLEFVWLDPKVTTGIEQMLEAQRDALIRAKQKNRKLKIYYGIPSTDILNAYRQTPLADSTDVLCELSPDIVRSLHSCKAWGPRWTNGLQTSDVDALHKEGYEVYPWTIDDPDYMIQFLGQGSFDGILSNYPSMLTGLYYQRGSK
jgi:glycerophosphoryl diester phosphodiesterase